MADDRGTRFIVVLTVFLVLTWLSVSLRCYVKGFINKGWAADDFLLLLSLVLYTACAACGLLEVKYGIGRHLDDIPAANIPKVLFFLWLSEVFYTMTTMIIRLSIAAFLLRIAVRPLHRRIIFGTMGVVLAISLLYLFLVIFQCHPVSFFWNRSSGVEGSCSEYGKGAVVAFSAVSFTADWVMGLLPMFLIYNLRMNSRTKVSLAGVLSLGLLAGVAAMIRVPYIEKLSLSEDFLYDIAVVAIWAVIESGLGIVAAGAITLRPLFRTFFSRSTPNTSTGPFSKHRGQRLPTQSQTNDLGQLEMGPWQHTHKSSVLSEGDYVEEQLKSESAVIRKGGSMRGKLPKPKNGLERRSENTDRKGGMIKVLRTVEVKSEDSLERTRDENSLSSVESPNVS